MKNTVFVLGICLTSCLTWAQTTCEGRVDAHQNASTMQRVRYCLAPDEDVSVPHNPGLVFSGVSSPKEAIAQPSQKEENYRARNGKFTPQDIQVTNVFVETRRFPKVSDGRVSQQEIVAKKEAVREGKQMAQQAVAQSECAIPEGEKEEVRRPVLRQMKDMPLKRACTKPARKVKKIRKKTVKPVAVETTTVPQVQEMKTTESFVSDLPKETQESQEIAVGTASYAPAGQDIAVGTVSYEPAN